MKVFTDTNYREHGAGDLVEYLDKEDGLRNRLGEQMSDEEIEAFIEKSEAYDFERQIIISPSNGEQLSDRELSHHTRKVMSEFCTDRQTATYCYAIHRDTDHPHTQVAVTGTKRDLWMDPEDCEALRELATKQFHEQHNELTTELDQAFEVELGAELDTDLGAELEAELDADVGATPADASEEPAASDVDQGRTPEQGQASERDESPGHEPEVEPSSGDEL